MLSFTCTHSELIWKFCLAQIQVTTAINIEWTDKISSALYTALPLDRVKSWEK
jgi:hypothetical protein